MISVVGASEHNLKNIDCEFETGAISIVTGVSGSGKSSLVFDTLLSEAQRKFFYTLSHYSRQFLDINNKAKVKKVTGLSPAISLSQNEAKPSSRASVGSLTDLNELLGVAFARFAERYCPKHDTPTTKQTPEEIAQKIAESYKGMKVVLYAPVVEEKKGAFQRQLSKIQAQGFLKAYIDGSMVDLVHVPKLDKDKKHTIKVVVDQFKVSEKSLNRLNRSVSSALDMGDGICQTSLAEEEEFSTYSTHGGCAKCSFAWPELDPRYFSPNSLGRCKKCNGKGSHESEEFHTILFDTCATCEGTGLSNEYLAIKLKSHSIASIHLMSINQLDEFFRSQEMKALAESNSAFKRLFEEISGKLDNLKGIGLGYLNLSRRILSLSGGEHQRLRLAGIMSENLRGVIYILDEPSQGLHPSELGFVWEALVDLKEAGNTVIVVDHDSYFMERADYIYDLGPTGGINGGNLLAKFAPKDASKYKKVSKTALYLSSKPEYFNNDAIVSTGSNVLIKKPQMNNLEIDSVSFKVGKLNVVSGVSGAGKTTLAIKILFENVVRYLEFDGNKFKDWWNVDSIDGFEHFMRALFIDRSSISRSTVSMPATYLDVLGDLRKLFAKLPDSQVMGYTVKTFSLNLDQGRCQECKGKGYISLSMKFLADVRRQCSQCHGRRFQDQVLEVKYQGLSIFEVLELSLAEFVDVFKNHKRLVKKILPAVELGLGYLKLGQPTATLSGGEAQRLKLAPLAIKKDLEKSLIIINEVTRGLHFEDIEKLLNFLRSMTSQGATIVISENSPELIRGADHLVELGPGAAELGGKLVYSGVPQLCRKTKESRIGPFL